MNLKYTDEFLIKSARKHKTVHEWRTASNRHYEQATRRGLIPEIRKFMDFTPKKNKPAYTESDLAEDAKRFSTRRAWEADGKLFMADGMVSPYHCALRYGPEFFKKHCQHMHQQHHRWTDDEIVEAASHYKHRNLWKRAGAPLHGGASHSGAYQAALKRPDVFARATAHMTLAESPYSKAYIVYAYEFSDNHAYVGITFKPAMRKFGHLNRGPVFDHTKICQACMYRVVQEKIASPREAGAAECFHIEAYTNAGWIMLNSQRGGGLGMVHQVKWKKEMVLAEALKYKTRKAWAVSSQVSYTAAKKCGWFAEAIAHMPKYDATWQMGRQFSPETLEKMSQAKLGGTLSPEHRSKIAESGQAAREREQTLIAAGDTDAIQRDQHMRAAKSEARIGMQFTDEHRENIRQAVLARPPRSDEARRNQSLAQTGTHRGPYSNKLSPDVRAARRKETYARHYLKTRDVELARLKTKNDAERLRTWTDHLAARNLPLDTPLPDVMSPLSVLSDEQRLQRKRDREQVNRLIRLATAAGNMPDLEKYQAERVALDEICLDVP